MKKYLGIVTSVVVVGILIFISEKWVCFVVPLCAILSSVSIYPLIKSYAVDNKHIYLLLSLGIWHFIPILLVFLQNPAKNMNFTLPLFFLSLLFLFWPFDKAFRNTESRQKDSEVRYRFIVQKWTWFLVSLYLGYAFSYTVNSYILQYISSPGIGYFLWVIIVALLLITLVTGLVVILYQLNYWVWFYEKKKIIDIQGDKIILFQVFSSKRVIQKTTMASCKLYRKGLLIIWNHNSIQNKVYLRDQFTHSPEEIVHFILNN